MSAVAETEAFAADDRLAKRNAWVLAVAQALAGGNNTMIAATAGIIGSVLAPGKVLATLGWVALNAVMFPPVLAAGALVVWIALRIRAQAV